MTGAMGKRSEAELARANGVGVGTGKLHVVPFAHGTPVRVRGVPYFASSGSGAGSVVAGIFGPSSAR